MLTGRCQQASLKIKFPLPDFDQKGNFNLWADIPKLRIIEFYNN
jgi:hypothetical protein